MSVEPLQEVSHEVDGRILTGAGADAATLATTMARGAVVDESIDDEAVDSAQTADVTSETPVTQDAGAETDRNPDGTFKPKVTRGAKRFDQLTGEREAAIRRAEAAERRLQELERERQAPRADTKPAIEEAKAPKFEDFADAADPLLAFMDARDAYREAQLEAKFDARLRERIEADRASRSLTERIESVKTRAREVYPDFDAVLETADVMFAPEVLQAIVKSDRSEHIQYALAKDRATSLRIAAMPRRDAQDMIDIGLALAQLVPARDVAPRSASTSAVAQTTNAPAPIQPVGAGARTASPPLEDLAASGDYESYKARRSSEMRGVARR